MRRTLAGLFLALLGLGQGLARGEPLGYDGARHLLARTGFGATEAEVAAFSKLDRVRAVERLLAESRREALVKPPAFADEAPTPFYKIRQSSVEERQKAQRENIELGLRLREWWFREMLITPSPITERMTLFWHNHFATSQQKVRSPQLMYRQNALLRREALGNFGTLLHAVAKDPAMLIYLDNAGSRRRAPNENFAREVMELFTLGEGHYTEKDVKEAARAFTGWSLDRDTLAFTNRRLWHDAGEKTVLGRTGRFDGDAVLDILLERRETAEFLVAKLWREFVSASPDGAEVRRLAAVFRQARYEVKPLLRSLLTSEAFWSPANRAALIKSPVELVVGTLRTFDIRPFTLRPAVVASAFLGQNPMSPPNVKGWPGGGAWIDSATLLGRKQVLERIFRGADAAPDMMLAQAPPDDMAKGAEPVGPESRFRRMMERGMQTYAFDWDRWAQAFPDGPERGARIERFVLATAAVNPVPEGLQGAELVRHLTADPVYQLK